METRTNQEIIDLIPSKALREHLQAHPIAMTVLQQATIVSEFAPTEHKAALFEKFVQMTPILEERLLLESAVADIKKYGRPGQKTNRIYDRYFDRGGMPPLFPFLEICSLPVLYKKGDIISDGRGRYCVASGPRLSKYADFSDECYLAYSLSNEIRSETDLFAAHNHIHVCIAQQVPLKELTEKEKKIKESILCFLK